MSAWVLALIVTGALVLAVALLPLATRPRSVVWRRDTGYPGEQWHVRTPVGSATVTAIIDGSGPGYLIVTCFRSPGLRWWQHAPREQYVEAPAILQARERVDRLVADRMATLYGERARP